MKITTRPNIKGYEHLDEVKVYVKKSIKLFLICLGIVSASESLRYMLGVADKSTFAYILNGVSIIFMMGAFKAVNVLLVYKWPTFSLNSLWFDSNSEIGKYKKWVLSQYTESEYQYVDLRKNVLDSLFLVVFFVVLISLFIISAKESIDYIALIGLSLFLVFSLIMTGYYLKALIRFNKTVKDN